MRPPLELMSLYITQENSPQLGIHTSCGEPHNLSIWSTSLAFNGLFVGTSVHFQN